MLKKFNILIESTINQVNYDNCPICGEKYCEQCRCPSFMHKTIEHLKKGHGRRCKNGHRWSGDLVYNPLTESKIYTQDEMKKIFIPLLKKQGETFQKIGKVLVRPAKTGEKITTITSSGIETINTAKEGDVIIQNDTDEKEEYILSKEKLESRYQKTNNTKDGMDIYLAKGKCIALTYEGAEHGMDNKIKFIAPWNEEMVLEDGDKIVTTEKMDEIYRIDRKSFEQTYSKTVHDSNLAR